MSKNFEHIIHKKSNQVINGSPKLPTSSQIEYGEIAINYAKDNEKISLKNSNNEIVTFSPDSNFVTIKDFDDTEHAIAAALNDLDERISESGDNVESQINDLSSDINDVKQLITDNEIVTSAALNDLNTRLIYVSEDIEDKQDTLVSGTNIKTINNESILGNGNITIQGSGSGDTNVIEVVKVNGTALTPDANKAVDVPVPTALSGLTDDSTHRVVTDTEKSTWNSKAETYIYDIDASNLDGNGEKIVESSTPYTAIHAAYQAGKTIYVRLTNNSGYPLILNMISTSGYTEGGYEFTAMVQNGDAVFTAHVDIAATEYYIECHQRFFLEDEEDPVFTASAAHGITSSDISNWNSKTSNVGTITGITMNGASKGTSGVVDLGTVITSHQDISGKADKSAAIGSLSLSLNSTNYQITLSGTKVDGTTFTVSDIIDLPLESVVVNGSYNDTTKKVVLTLQNGSTIDFSVADLVAGLQTEITSTNKLSADLISDGTTNKTVTATEKSTWNGKQDALSNASVLSGITSTKVSNWDDAATNSHTHSNKTVLDGISSTDISNWNSKTDNVGTVTGVKMNGTTNTPTSGVVDLGTVVTSETALSKGTTTGSGNAVTDISVSGHRITLTKGTTFLTSHQDIKTLNGTALTGTGNITLTGVPAFTSADNGKILGVVNGQLAWVTPTTIYTGTGTPSSSQGNDGDIYLQTS